MSVIEHGSDLSDLPDPEEEGRTLSGQRVRVQLADGTAFVTRITNREYVAWDKTAPRKKWGSAKDVPFLAATFMAWAAAKREDLTGLSFDAFCEAAEGVETLEDEEEEDVARPTRREAGGDSS